MDAHRSRAKEVFLHVRDLPQLARAHRLREICGDDARLLDEVASLLRYDVQTDGDVAPDADEHDPDLSGWRVDRFVLTRRLGSGGMGAVWEAEEEHPRRKVAIKILRHGITSTRLLRRFEHEVEVLGRLQHPSVAQIHAAGTFEHAGRRVPYFAMELVAGALTFDAYVRARGLSARERLRLFAMVCDAVHHGHQRGVIHRDLKPSNVLVGPDGVPKVIDFGVARATDSDVTVTTRHGELLGTLSYMSPEQCELDPAGLDSRTDVYSLGVVLYEALCGRPPYDVRTMPISAATRTIREHDPEPPGRIVRALRGDVESVVLRCLEKDPQRRYPSAAELAADIRRYLAGDPVEARRPGRWRRLVRWSGRHPIATAASIGGCLLAASIGSLFVGSSLAELPWRVQVDTTAHEAVLFSFADKVMKRWRAPEGGFMTYAGLTARHPELGGGTVVAVTLDAPPHSASLCLFEAFDLETPYWTSAAIPLVLPEGEPEREGTRFIVQTAALADVFEDVPGEELVVLHRLVPYSATCIRIHDLAGSLHYEAWHDGGLGSVRLLADSNVLLIGGLHSENSWIELGVETGASAAVYPAVVFALRPERGRTDLREFIVRQGEPVDPTLVWYRWLGPTDRISLLDDVNAIVWAAGGGWSADRHAQVEFHTGSSSTMQPPARFSLVLDASGREVDRIVSHPYWRWERAGRLPPCGVFRLYDLVELPRR